MRGFGLGLWFELKIHRRDAESAEGAQRIEESGVVAKCARRHPEVLRRIYLVLQGHLIREGHYVRGEILRSTSG